MSLKLGINGFGRIGRCVVRAIIERGLSVEIVGINDLTDTKTLAHLLKYDSNHGIAKFDVSHSENALLINGKNVPIFAEKDPTSIPWDKVGADVVVESTGLFTTKEGASKHLTKGVKKVIISAPATNEDITVVLGVNFDKYNKAEHTVISNASCTTNCLAPVAKVIDDNFKVIKGTMLTVHSYTNDQRILDLPHSDLRRARAGALSMIPTSTGAAKAIGSVIPNLKGKLDGLSVRVPTPTVSITEAVFAVEKETTAEAVNTVLKAAADGAMKGILAYSNEPLVSIDYKGNAHSSIVDGLSTKVLNGNMIQLLSWYDNEWGYSNRVAELVTKVL